MPAGDSTKVYTAKSLNKTRLDTSTPIKIAFPQDRKPAQFENYLFQKNAFGVGVLAIPVKYRPTVNDFLPQLNATFNGAIYVGFHSGIYQLSYSQTPLRIFKRDITLLAYSFGVFTGIGTARIDPYVTNDNINIEYDGAVILSGLNVIAGAER